MIQTRTRRSRALRGGDFKSRPLAKLPAGRNLFSVVHVRQMAVSEEPPDGAVPKAAHPFFRHRLLHLGLPFHRANDFSALPRSPQMNLQTRDFEVWSLSFEAFPL